MKKFDLNIADKRDSKLIWEKSTNEWYLCLTTKVEKKQHQADHENRVVSLDPGNRTLQLGIHQRQVLERLAMVMVKN